MKTFTKCFLLDKESHQTFPPVYKTLTPAGGVTIEKQKNLIFTEKQKKKVSIKNLILNFIVLSSFPQ